MTHSTPLLPAPSVPPQPVPRALQVPPGIPFHRLARIRPRYRWWLTLLTGVVGAALFFGLSMLVTFVVLLVSQVTGSAAGTASMPTPAFDVENPWGFALLAAGLIILIPALALASRWVQGRGVGYLLSVTGRIRWRWLARSLLIAFAVFTPFFLLPIALSALAGVPVDFRPGHPGVPLMLLLVLLLVPLQSAAEEYVFRGYLMQLVGGWFARPIFAIVLPAPLFMLGHMYDVWGSLSVGVMAVVAGWLCWRTGGLEAAIALHVANNVLVFGLGTFGLAEVNMTEGSPIGLAIQTGGLVVFAAIIARASRRVDRYTVSASASKMV